MSAPMTPSTMPATEKPPLVASPRLARPRPSTPKITARIPRTIPPMIVQDDTSASRPSTKAATPKPLRGGASRFPGAFIGFTSPRRCPRLNNHRTRHDRLALLRRDELDSTQRGLQRGRDPHRAVGLLVVFQDGDDPAGGGQGAVEGRCDLQAPVSVAVAGAQPAGLGGGAVGGGGELTVGPLGRQPGLAVELAGR